MVKLDGTFVARDRCEALQSIHKGSNPGNLSLTPGQQYEVIGQNRPRPSHYLLRLETARPPQRWVSVDCGSLSSAPLSETAPVSSEPVLPEPVVSEPGPPEPEPLDAEQPGPTQPDLSTSQDADFLLALSWQPAFCETRPTKIECRNQVEDSFEAANLALHGLWPQPRGNDYCGVSSELEQLDKAGRWDQLPPIELSAQTRTALAEQMPGYASGLHLHEWYKHGTCYSNSPEEYYIESLVLMDQINGSLVQELFAAKVGQQLSGREIRAAFDRAFGAGAGDKVEVACAQDIDQGQRRMVQELRINLRGRIEPGSNIAELLQSAPQASAGCRGGLVDRAGVGQ